jgi:hypothetical protein
MNAQLHTSLKTTPFEVVFRQKKPINWLTVQERREAKGVETEDGEVITEESLSKELEEEKDEEVIAGFRETSEFLNIRVPAPGSTTTAKKATPRPASPPKELPATPRATRVVPLPAASAISSLNLQRNRLHHHHHPLYVHLYLLNRTSLRWSQLNQSHLQTH